jgi:hypothetical protein
VPKSFDLFKNELENSSFKEETLMNNTINQNNQTTKMGSKVISSSIEKDLNANVASTPICKKKNVNNTTKSNHQQQQQQTPKDSLNKPNITRTKRISSLSFTITKHDDNKDELIPDFVNLSESDSDEMFENQQQQQQQTNEMVSDEGIPRVVFDRTYTSWSTDEFPSELKQPNTINNTTINKEPTNSTQKSAEILNRTHDIENNLNTTHDKVRTVLNTTQTLDQKVNKSDLANIIKPQTKTTATNTINHKLNSITNRQSTAPLKSNLPITKPKQSTTTTPTFRYKDKEQQENKSPSPMSSTASLSSASISNSAKLPLQNKVTQIPKMKSPSGIPMPTFVSKLPSALKTTTSLQNFPSTVVGKSVASSTNATAIKTPQSSRLNTNVASSFKKPEVPVIQKR